MTGPVPTPVRNTMAITGAVCGAVGFVCVAGSIGLLGIVLGLIGLVCSGVACQTAHLRWLAVVGVVVSALTLLAVFL